MAVNGNEQERGFMETRKNVAARHSLEEIKAYFEAVLMAVFAWRCIEFASGRMRASTEVVLAAVTQNGRTLEYAFEELKNNVEVVLAAVIENGYALEFAPNNIKARCCEDGRFGTGICFR